MNLDRTTAVIRPRQPWEAIDLGFALTRSWWRPILDVWLVWVLPIWIVLVGLLPIAPLWALFLLWWLKPIYDIPVLQVVSQSLFGSTPARRETLRLSLRHLGRHGLRLLFWRRLDPSRSFFLPLFLLEGASGRQLRDRVRLVGKRGVLEESSRLAMATWLIELCLFLGLVGLVVMVAPAGTVDVDRSFENLVAGAAGFGTYWILGCFWFLAMTLAEPCYVAAGFCLYLNRRTQLEGWDVQVGLQRLGLRVRRESKSSRGTLGIPLILVGVLLAVGARADDSKTPNGAADPHSVIQDVLQEPEFVTTERVGVWRLKSDLELDSPPPDFGTPWVFTSWVGMLFEALVWIVVLASVGWLLWALIRSMGTSSWVPARLDPPDQTPTSFVLANPEGRLPDDVATAALAELSAGRTMAALSLLYRGSLASIVLRRGLDVPANWTEEQCLAQVGVQVTEPVAKYLKEVTEAWQVAAYAHRVPPDPVVRDLCERFGRGFGGLP